MCNCLHEVRLTEARCAVEEKRVVSLSWRLSDRACRGHGKFVGAANNKFTKRISLTKNADTDALRALWWRYNGAACRCKQIHLRSLEALLFNAENNRDRVSKANRTKALEKQGVLRLVPLDRPLVWRRDHQDATVKLLRDQWGEPGAHRVFW